MRDKGKKSKGTKKAAEPKAVKAKTAKAKTAPVPRAEAKRTIKTLVIETLTAKPATTNDEMIAAVKAEFPGSAFDARHAAWYRSQARTGKLTGTPIEIGRVGGAKGSAPKE